MADFYQTGVVATFHRLGKVNLEKTEAELTWYTQGRPIALVLPSLYTELEGDALGGIVRELKEVKYIEEIVITLGPALKEEFRRAKEFFSVLPQKTRIIWNTGPKIDEIYKAIEAAEITDPITKEKRTVVRVNEALCQGCGACVAVCRPGALNLRGFTDEQVLAALESLCLSK